MLSAVAVVLVSAAAALGQLAVDRPSREQAELADRGERVRPFRISGSVRGLYPGASGQLRLKLENPHPFKIIVRRIKVRVGDASAGCPAAYLTIPSFKGRIHIRAKQRMRFNVVARMSPAAPSSCQNARFPLTYRGKAVRR